MVRLIETDCTVTYEGRGSTFRDRGVRLLVIKDDGSFLVHKSTGVKPQNYMTNTVSIEEDVDSHGVPEIIVRSKSEEIVVTMYEVMFDMTMPSMPVDTSKTVALGTEAQFQAWMTEPSRWTSIYGEDRLFVSREVDSGNGSMDLFGVAKDGSRVVVVELKRHSRRNDVFQVERYREALKAKAADPTAFQEFKDMLTNKAVDNGVGVDAMRAIGLITPGSLEDADCWLVGSDMGNDVDEFAAQHDIKAIAVGDGWIDQAVPDDLARKAKTLSKGEADVRAVDQKEMMGFGGSATGTAVRAGTGRAGGSRRRKTSSGGSAKPRSSDGSAKTRRAKSPADGGDHKADRHGLFDL